MINKHNKLKTKNILIASLLSIAFFFAIFSGMFFGIGTVSASGKQQLTISNGDFSNHSTSTSSQPGSPSNWTFVNPNDIELGLKRGVFNIDDYLSKPEYFEIKENPFDTPGLPSGSEIKTSLMINSYDGHHSAGYESTNISLDAGSYYSISVYALAQNGAQGAIYLSGLSNDEEQAKIIYIMNDTWSQYTIFIATSEFTNESITLQLFLGGKEPINTSSGAMFFTKVDLMKYSQTTFNTVLSQSPTGTTHKIILTDEKHVAVDNGNFEDKDISNETILGFKTLDSENSVFADNTLKVVSATDPSELTNSRGESLKLIAPGTNNSPDNENVLFMHNKTNSYQGIESSDIEIKRNTAYKLSVWAKSNASVGNGATLKLLQQNVAELENFTDVSASLQTKTTFTENRIVNNWSQYSFYVKGHPLQNTVLNLQILLGTKNQPTNGYVFIDQIEIQKLTSSQYEKGVSGENVSELSFTQNNDQFNIKNGNFNLMHNAEKTISYPAVPKDWTVALLTEHTNENEIITGIVSTTNSDFDMVETKTSSMGLRAINPGLTPALDLNEELFNTENTPNNVFMMGQSIQAKQSATSSELTLSAGGIHKLTFSVNTQLANTNSKQGAHIALYNNSNKFFEVVNLNTENTWKTYSFYIKTNKQITTAIELSLNDVSGYVFYDDFRLHSATEQEFIEAQENSSNTTYALNLQIEAFNNYTFNNNLALNTPFNWTATASEDNTTAVYGILDTNKLSESIFSHLPNPMPTNGKNVLFAYSMQDDIITLSTTSTYTLSQGSYNKVVIRLKTYRINQEEDNQMLDINDKPLSPGVQVKLDTHQGAFSAINTEELNSTSVNDWIDLEFYINPDTQLEVKPQISLGYEGATTSGILYVDNIGVVVMTEEEYKQEVKALENSKTKIALTELAEIEPEEPVVEEPKFESGNFDFVLLSSIVMGVALILALLATALRRIKITRKPKIKTTYDRKRTLELEMNKKERISFRREIIDNLQVEFDAIDREINEYILEDERKLEELKAKHKRKTEKYESIKQAIVLEINTLTDQHNELNKYITDRDQIKLNKESYEHQIGRLKSKQLNAEKKSELKQSKLAQIEAKRKRYLEKQEYRKKLIKQEIEIIEREIAEIAKEEEIMWSEYRKAKEVAKQEKLEYYANKRAAKREQKESRKQEKAERTKKSKQEQSSEKETSENNKEE